MDETPKKPASPNKPSLNNNNERIYDQSLTNKSDPPKDDKMTTSKLDKFIVGNELAVRTVTSSVQKWGNSLAVRIPKDMAENKAFEQGTAVEIIETADGLKIVLKKKKIEYQLADLLSQCKPENCHETIDFGVAGKELI
jgi:antitoxin MazE